MSQRSKVLVYAGDSSFALLFVLLYIRINIRLETILILKNKNKYISIFWDSSFSLFVILLLYSSVHSLE
jgi:hypothetical protein